MLTSQFPTLEHKFQCDFACYKFPHNSPSQPESEGPMQRMLNTLWNIWNDDQAQDIAEYALMLVVILLIVVAAVTAIGGNANAVFNAVAGKLNAG